MRFRGGGVGHKSTREATDSFKKDRDPLDKQVTDAGFEWDEVGDDEPISDMAVEEDDELIGDSEEEDYGYVREDSEDESDRDTEDGDEQVDFGPEDDGGTIDPDMDALGYAEL